MNMKKFRLEARWYLWILLLAPLIVLVNYVSSRSVNVPFWDQWELVPILHHLREGHFILNDFWQQHNEHRLIVPRMIMVALAILTKWNVYTGAFVNVVIAAAAFIVLMNLYIKTSWQLKLKPSFLVAMLMSTVWFSILQQENWLWGWQIEWFIIGLGLVSVLLVLSDAVQNELTWPKVSYMIAATLIAQFSLGNGMLIWPIALAILLYLRADKKKIAVVAGSALFATLLYFWNYHSPENTPSKLVVLRHPWSFLRYVFIYLGRPLTSHETFAPVLGFAMLAIFAGLTAWLFLKHKDRFRIVLPWIGLGVFAILSAVITASSRMNFGLAQAYTSRYTTIASFLVVSIVALVFFSLDEIKKTIPFIKWIALLLLAGTAWLVISNASGMVKTIDEHHQYLSDIRSCTHAADIPYEACILSAYPNRDLLLERLHYLKKIHWGGY